MSIFPVPHPVKTASERFLARFPAVPSQNPSRRVSFHQLLLVELQGDLFAGRVGEFGFSTGAVLVTPPLSPMGGTFCAKNDQQGELFAC